jgi:adenylate cyclase
MSSRLPTLGGFAPELLQGADNIASIGTHFYPPTTRRRLKALNVGSFTVAVSCLLFAITYALENAPLYRDAILVNLALMLVALSVPAFHRINEIAGVLLMSAAFLFGLFVLVALVGRESGIQINFIAASAALFPILDLKRIRLLAFLIAVAIALHVASWGLFAHGQIRADPQFLTQLYYTVVVTISIIIAVLVYYAFWTAEQAEAETETLLHRILPAPVAERLKAKPDAAISDSFGEASVLFSDIVGFVPIT